MSTPEQIEFDLATYRSEKRAQERIREKELEIQRELKAEAAKQRAIDLEIKREQQAEATAARARRPVSSTRRKHVLLKPNDEIAAALRAKPLVWMLVATGDAEDRRILISTACRISDGRMSPHGMKDFPADETGRYEARATSAKDRPDAVAAVEMMARFVPYQ